MTYPNICSMLKDRKIGDWEIDHFTITINDLRAMLDGIKPGRYVRLSHRAECVMSDTDMEKRTNQEFCDKAYGDVLIGGLGIGLIILAIQDKPEVKSITIIEKHQEVIDLVIGQLPFNDKVQIIHADVFHWWPPKGCFFDIIYMDIWNYVDRNVYEDEMLPLIEGYSMFLKDNASLDNIWCWAEHEAKNNLRL